MNVFLIVYNLLNASMVFCTLLYCDIIFGGRQKYFILDILFFCWNICGKYVSEHFDDVCQLKQIQQKTGKLILRYCFPVFGGPSRA